jgi:hypothetical protein
MKKAEKRQKKMLVFMFKEKSHGMQKRAIFG